MKFRTEIEPFVSHVRIGYENRILALGSCFAAHMAERLSQRKFHVTASPTGILFNPMSIAATLDSLVSAEPVTREELGYDGENYFNFDFHGDFSAPTVEVALEGMNHARKVGAEALKKADRLLLTFGTAWVYEHEGHVVANCHRQPSSEFVRRRLSVEEITERFEPLIEGPLKGKKLLLSVSPVRHIGDGLAGNAVSKATLRLAVEELCTRHPQIDYFPAYEILTDDLRDYRFYADDLVHPSLAAVEYVWEKFSESVLTSEAQALQPRIEEIVSAAAHRPRNPHSEAHRRFCRQCLERIEALPQMDFRAEAEYFRQCIEINS